MYYVCDKKDGKYGIKDTKDGVVEYFTRAQIAKMYGKLKILGVKKDFTTSKLKIVVIKYNYSSASMLVDHLERYIKGQNVRDLGHDRYVTDESNQLRYETRFLGGFGAWSGSEDLCDAEVLDSKVYTAVRKACKEFEKATGVSVSVFTGEKAWCYFDFE